MARPESSQPEDSVDQEIASLLRSVEGKLAAHPHDAVDPALIVFPDAATRQQRPRLRDHLAALGRRRHVAAFWLAAIATGLVVGWLIPLLTTS